MDIFYLKLDIRKPWVYNIEEIWTKRGSYSMMKIPVENLGLFEQLDRIVVAFFSKQQSSSPYDLNVSITQEHLDQKKQELEPLGYQAVQRSE